MADAGVNANVASVDASTARGPYRGKCLYKTGKCPNERALKTSGAAHNLCDEHRRRQNEHQRKLDSKNRFSRKDKRTGARVHLADDADAAAAAEGLAPLGSEATKRYERANVKNVATDPAAGADAAAAAAAMAAAAAAVNGSLHALAAAPTAGLSAAALPTHQPSPHTAYPYMMQEFDGIMVPLPSCFEGHDRVEVRARVHQKVLDFISEECIRRFSSKAAGEPSFSSGATLSHPQQQTSLMSPQQQHLRGLTNGMSSDAALTASGLYAPQLLQQQQQQHEEQQQAMYQGKGARGSEREKRAAQGVDAASLSDGDGDDNGSAADRELELRAAKKPRTTAATARSLRDRPGKHPRADA